MKITAKTGLLIEGVGLFHVMEEWENLRKYVCVTDSSKSFIAQFRDKPMFGWEANIEETIWVVSASDKSFSEAFKQAHIKQTQPVRAVYNELVSDKYTEYRLAGYTQNKSSRMANKYAIQNTWKLYNTIKENQCQT